MKMLSRSQKALTAFVLLLLCSCTANSPKGTTEAVTPAKSDVRNTAPQTVTTQEKEKGVTRPGGSQSPTLGSLEFRDRTVTILSGARGPVYTVTTKDGTTIAKEVSEQELQAKFPDLYRRIKTGVAGNDASVGRAIR